MNIILVAAVVVVALSGTSESKPVLAPKLVTIATVLTSPSNYDGQLIHIKGAAVVRFEADYICDRPEMIDSEDSKKCLWLGSAVFDPKAMNEAINISNLHRKIVDITGRFHAEDHGHMGEYGGAVSPISATILGVHERGDIPPIPAKPSSAN